MIKKNKDIKKGKATVGFLKYQFDYLSLCYLLLLGIIFINVYHYTYDKKIFLGGDNAAYYITGYALAEGKGYSNIHMPHDSPANHFPPGYPFIISIIISMFGDNIQTIKTSNGFFLFGVISLVFVIIKKLTQNKNLAFIVSLATLLNAHLLFYSYIKMSEVPFAFFTLLSVWLFMQTFTKGDTLKQLYFWALIISLIITFYIRSLGIAAIGASTIILLLNKRRVQALILMGCFILAYTPWYIRSESLGGNAYAKQVQMINIYRPDLGKMKITDYPKRFIENLDRYVSKEIGSAVFGYTITDYKKKPDWKNYLYGSLLILLSLIGILSLKEFKWFLLMLIGGTFFILMLWPPVWIGIRFMLPFVPLLLFSAIQGVLFMISRLIKVFAANKIFWNYAPFLCILIIPQSKAQIQILNQNSKAPYNPNYASYFNIASWCKTNLPDTAIIATRKPELFFLQAHRKVTGYNFTKDNELLINDLKKNGVTHVVTDNLGYSSTGLYLSPAVMNNPEKFKLIKEDGKKGQGTYLFQVYYDQGYVGEFKNGKRNGIGKVKYPDGSMYEGEWHENLKVGSGKYMWPNGEYYLGEFRNDKREGRGTMFSKDGNYMECEWKNDKPSGNITRFNKEGKIIAKGHR